MPESIALTFLFFGYLAAFGILAAFVGRTYLTTRRLEEELARVREELAPTDAAGGSSPSRRATAGGGPPGR